MQAKYSILDRALEAELLPLCQQNGIVVQVYSPLEQGLLTGTIGRDYVPGGARANKVWFQRENMLRVIDMLEQWQPLCENIAVPSSAGAGVDIKAKRSHYPAERRYGARAGARECRCAEHRSDR